MILLQSENHLDPTQLKRLSSEVSYFRKLISEPAGILVVAHHNPDGDTLGASLALYHFLVSLGQKADVLVPNDPPAFLKWMPGCDKFIIYQQQPDRGDQLISEAEIIFFVDFNGSSRVKFFSDKLLNASATKVLIDHHPQPENEFDLLISDTDVSSTSELMYSLLEAAGYEGSITKEMAECFFVGIMTDTGSYSYSCNRAETFDITAKLISLGVDVERIHRLVYDTYSESRMRLLGFCLSERLKVIPEYSTAYIWLTRTDLDKFDYQPGDTEGVVNYALSIQNISLAALFTEREDRIRISLRSKGEFPVNEIARNHFKGGGHRNAAGADAFDTMQNTLAYFETLLRTYQDRLKQNLEDYF